MHVLVRVHDSLVLSDLGSSDRAEHVAPCRSPALQTLCGSEEGREGEREGHGNACVVDMGPRRGHAEVNCKCPYSMRKTNIY